MEGMKWLFNGAAHTDFHSSETKQACGANEPMKTHLDADKSIITCALKTCLSQQNRRGIKCPHLPTSHTLWEKHLSPTDHTLNYLAGSPRSVEDTRASSWSQTWSSQGHAKWRAALTPFPRKRGAAAQETTHAVWGKRLFSSQQILYKSPLTLELYIKSSVV